ncbi:hypothetical protein Leryth_022600, partial [Lithospermum erythrorhizon]
GANAYAYLRGHLIEVPNQQNEIIRVDVPAHRLNEVLEALNCTIIPNKNSLINIRVEGTHFEHEEDADEDDSTRMEKTVVGRPKRTCPAPSLQVISRNLDSQIFQDRNHASAIA